MIIFISIDFLSVDNKKLNVYYIWYKITLFYNRKFLLYYKLALKCNDDFFLSLCITKELQMKKAIFILFI